MPTSSTIDLSERTHDLSELLTFPLVATKLMEACNSGESGVRELSQIIECDPTLSLKLLQISNSSLYGCAGRVKTVQHAAVILGVRQLRNLALSAAAAEVFASGEINAEVSKQLWSHSLGCATIAKVICQTAIDDVEPEEAFIAGLVHDIGKLILWKVLGEKYDLIPLALGGATVVPEEQNRYGTSHPELGALCCEDWGLPCEIGDAIGHHHCPTSATTAEPLACVIGASNQLAKIWQIGSSAELMTSPAEALEVNGLDVSDTELEQIATRAPEAYAASCQAFEA